MRYRYTKYAPNLVDDLDIDELTAKLSDLLLASGFGDGMGGPFDGADRTMQALHDANAIGLQGVGVRAFVRDLLPRLARHQTAVLVNICGDTVEEYAEVARVMSDAPGVAGLEVNISCPNVKKGGLAFGSDPRMTGEVVGPSGR